MQGTEKPARIATAGSARRAAGPALLERVTKTAFLATEFGLHDHAERIFARLAQLRPGSIGPTVGMAVVRARRGLVTQAIGELRAVLQMERRAADRGHPSFDMAKAVLAAMLVRAGEPGALALCDEVLARGVDPAAMEVVRGCIDLAREQATCAQAVPGELRRYHNIRA